MTERITPDLLLRAYAMGIFPMAESRDAEDMFWVDPVRRGVLPLDGFHLSRSLARRMRRGGYKVTLDQAFASVLDGCAAREETWINAEIRALYLDLFARGSAHSIEVWDGETLTGGVYGVTLGAAFFGESMFSRVPDASKLALAHLVDHLARQGFRLFDTQFLTAHLASLGGIEIPRATYLRQLRAALKRNAAFNSASPLPPGDKLAHRLRG
ncbi:MAG: leucyl/phenylalanyl-tRNA--protein transferase [Rubellimicrobium sp.]|nr:leucyl/phenylalanyl-tRNA--protein transferase [Rubellimicrobium sp.]